jgi:hypothetical protein
MKLSKILFFFVCFILSGLFFHIGYTGTTNALNELKENCKVCSFFDKDCPYTDEEFKEQEYGGGKCGDMGYYEITYKLSFMSYGLAVMFLIMPFVLKKGDNQNGNR